MNPLNWFKRLWRIFTGEQGERVARRIQAILVAALPLVEEIAKLTPTRIDDEIVALFNTYAVPGVDKYLALPRDQRGLALLHAATYELQKHYPEYPVNILQSGIQLAVSAMKVK